jgi:hypothetical protein
MPREPEFFVDATGRSAPERRKNPVLRELLDEMLAHVRLLAVETPNLDSEQLDQTRRRVEWLADEIWDAATHAAEAVPAAPQPAP